MLEFDEFRKYLKRRGKKSHVVEDLISRCRVFAEFLQQKRKTNIDDGTKEDLEAFYEAIKHKTTGVNNDLRAISLYYRFKSRSELLDYASSLREQRISVKRQPFKLRDFRGVKREYVKLLEEHGIVTVGQMLERGKTPRDRKELSEKLGIPLESILEYVKLSDLSRLGAIKSVRARLYFDAGVDTPGKMASWNPDELRKMLISYVKRSGFDGIAPLPKELKNAIETAKKVKRVVEYDKADA